MKTRKKVTASNFYYTPLTGAILHIIFYDDDSAKVTSNFQKDTKWTPKELYNFISLMDIFHIEFIGTV